MKQYFIFLPYCFCFLVATFSLQAQKNNSFSLEISTGIGFSDFLLAPNPLDGLWNPPNNINYTINTRTKVGLIWQVGLGVVKPINDRIDLRTNLSFYQGSFSHLAEGVVFASDILNPIDGKVKNSTFISDVRFTNIAIPLMGDFYWSDKATSFFNTIGVGVAATLKTKGHTIIFYSNGTTEDYLGPNPYEPETWKGFVSLGIGKRIPLGAADKQLTIAAQLNYYLAEEALQVFDSAGRLIHTNLQLAFRF